MSRTQIVTTNTDYTIRLPKKFWSAWHPHRKEPDRSTGRRRGADLGVPLTARPSLPFENKHSAAASPTSIGRRRVVGNPWPGDAQAGHTSRRSAAVSARDRWQTCQPSDRRGARSLV